jgi:tetratricopeptide (TPR) repeat protein
MARSRLALLYQRAGQGPRAEALLRQATEVIERTLGSDHPWFAVCLTTEANLRADAGDLQTAEAIERRALAILEKIGDTTSASYAGLLNNLGDVYRQREDYTRAREFFERAFAVTERVDGRKRYNVCIDDQNLGIIAREQDYVRALECAPWRWTYANGWGPIIGHRPLLNNLANVQRSTGDERHSRPISALCASGRRRAAPTTRAR